MEEMMVDATGRSDDARKECAVGEWRGGSGGRKDTQPGSSSAAVCRREKKPSTAPLGLHYASYLYLARA